MKRVPFILAMAAALAFLSGCPGDDDPAEICETHDDCTEESAPYCSPDEECVECVEDEHCGEGFSCTDDFVCEEDEVIEDCTSDDDCTEAGAEYCDLDSGDCVECLEDEHCGEGYTCTSELVCEEEAVADCDIEGFDAEIEESFYAEGDDGPVLGYIADTSAELPFDRLDIRWWFDWGVDYDGVGFYPVEQNTNLAECGLCVYIMQADAAGDVERLFFAVDGEIEITDIGGDGQPFDGMIHDAVLVEWDLENDEAIAGGEEWCLDGYTWETLLDGQLPCTDDDDCADGYLCDTDTGECVECFDDEHCDGDLLCHPETSSCVECIDSLDCEADEICAGNVCMSVDDCVDHELTVDAEFAAAEEDFWTGEMTFYYIAAEDDGDALQLEIRGDHNITTGTTHLGASAEDSCYHTCDTCLILISCEEVGDEEVCDYYFAIAGELDIIQIGAEDGDVFEATLQDAILQEVTIEEDGTHPVPGGELFCLADMSLSAYTNVECISDDDCEEPNGLCNTEVGVCVECLVDDDCPGDQICGASACIDLDTCDEEDFTPVSEFAATQTDWFGDPMAVVYEGIDDDGDIMALELWGEDNLITGIKEIGADYADGNYASCSNCVLIAMGCVDVDHMSECDQFFFAVTGEIDVQELGLETGDLFSGSLNDVALVEVTVDWESWRSTPVEDGAVMCLNDMDFVSYMNAECVEHEECGEDQFCHPESFMCVDCLEDEHCGDDLYCEMDMGICVECVENEHCPDGEACMQNECMVPAEGDTCMSPLAFEEGSFSGDFFGHTNYFTPSGEHDSCTGFGANGPDMVYEVALEDGQTLEVVYTVFEGDASLYVVSECIDGTAPVDHSGVCLMGVDDTLSNQPEEISYEAQGDETVYLVLDMWSFPDDLTNVTWEAEFTIH